MPAMVWCTNLSDTMPNAQSCCISSTGVDRPGSLHNTTAGLINMDSDTLPEVQETSAKQHTQAVLTSLHLSRNRTGAWPIDMCSPSNSQ